MDASLRLAKAVSWLDGHVNFEMLPGGIRRPPSLDRMAALCRVLGNPESSFPVVHVTGTNGKGSTVRMASALLAAHGLAIGTYTSPHVHRLNERLAYDGQPISDLELAEILEALMDLESLLPERPTWFELVTAAAFRFFSDRAVDVAVLEVGLGGTFDATNVARADVAVLTNVDLDHTDVLGSTRSAIARDKSGIVKAGSSFVCGAGDEEVHAALVPACERAGDTWMIGRDYGVERALLAHGGRLVDIFTRQARYEGCYVSLLGAHQAMNAATAVAAVEAFFGRPGDDDLVRDVLGQVRVPGRMEILGRDPLLVVDGAHNPAGMRALGEALESDLAVPVPRVSLVPATGADGAVRAESVRAGAPEEAVPEEAVPEEAGPAQAGIEEAVPEEAVPEEAGIVLVVGMLRGRDPAALLEALAGALRPGRLRAVVACAPASPRARSSDDVAAAAGVLGVPVHQVDSADEALALARSLAGSSDVTSPVRPVPPVPGIVVAAGSLYLVAEVRELALGIG